MRSSISWTKNMVGGCVREREAPGRAGEECEVFEGCYKEAGRGLFKSSDEGSMFG